MSEATQEADNPEQPTSIIPIFCTADIPAKTLDLLLTRDAAHRTDDSFRLHIITDASDTALAQINKRSQPPCKSFASPFAGMSLHQVNDFFLQHIKPLDAFTHNMFVVLDEHSVSDESCAVVQARSMTEDDRGLASLRTDFYVARQIVTPVEMGLEGLLENRDYQSVYTKDEVPLQY